MCPMARFLPFALFLLFVVPSNGYFSPSSLGTILSPVKRQEAVVQAVSIQPSQYWDGIDGPWSSFPLQLGSGSVGGQQVVRVMPSTAGNAIWAIAPQGCPSSYGSGCANSRGGLFLTNESLTWTPNSIYQTGIEANLNEEASGFAGFDHASLGWPGSPTVNNSHAIIFDIADSNYWLGIFGLNPTPTNFTTFSDPQTSFMTYLLDTHAIPSLTYGYTAGNQYRGEAGVFGSLTLGGYDANRFFHNDITFDFFADISRDLLVNLQTITTTEISPMSLLPGGPIAVYIDSTVPEIWFPASACAAFEAAFNITWNTTLNHYLITAEQRQRLLDLNPKVIFTMSPDASGGETNVSIELPYAAFDLQLSFPIVDTPTYYFPLMQAANETQYTLGRTVLQEAYIVVDYQRQNFSLGQCRWEQEMVQTPNIVTISPPTSASAVPSTGHSAGHRFSIAVVVGAAIGGAAVLAAVALGVFLVVQRKMRKAEQRRLVVEKANVVERMSPHRPLISWPMGGELGGNGVHEIAPPLKPAQAEMDGPYRTDPRQHGYFELGGNGYYKAYYQVQEMDGTTPIYEMPGEMRI